jgi:hypothetical protein
VLREDAVVRWPEWALAALVVAVLVAIVVRDLQEWGFFNG